MPTGIAGVLLLLLVIGFASSATLGFASVRPDSSTGTATTTTQNNIKQGRRQSLHVPLRQEPDPKHHLLTDSMEPGGYLHADPAHPSWRHLALALYRKKRQLTFTPLFVTRERFLDKQRQWDRERAGLWGRSNPGTADGDAY